MEYRVQKGKVNGNYKDVCKIESSDDAWSCYTGIRLAKGQKKRIQELSSHEGVKPKTLAHWSRLWT